MEQVINPSANSEKYIKETDLKISEFKTKLDSLENQYSIVIKSKNSEIEAEKKKVNDISSSLNTIINSKDSRISELENNKNNNSLDNYFDVVQKISVRNLVYTIDNTITMPHDLVLSKKNITLMPKTQYLISADVKMFGCEVVTMRLLNNYTKSPNRTFNIIYREGGTPYSNRLETKSIIYVNEPQFASEMGNSYRLTARFEDNNDKGSTFQIDSLDLYIINLTALKSIGLKM